MMKKTPSQASHDDDDDNIIQGRGGAKSPEEYHLDESMSAFNWTGPDPAYHKAPVVGEAVPASSIWALTS